MTAVAYDTILAAGNDRCLNQPQPFERRNDKRIEDVNLDHHDGCPAPQQIDEDESAFHSWFFSRTER